MPNVDNITSPITLVSFGRSGTSLIFNVLRAHPDVDACGETQPLIFGTWEGARRVGGVIRPDKTLPEGADHDLRCARAVRSVFLTTFPSDAPRWCHKPINVPFTIAEGQRVPPDRFAPHVPKYWHTLASSFPDGQVITVLRHPYDVALSAWRYWNNPLPKIWRSIVCMAQLLLHDDAPVGLALRHRAFVETPEEEITRLLDHVGLSHHPACFEAAKKVYVPKMGTSERDKADMKGHTARGFSHRAAWDKLDMRTFTDEDRQILVDMWAKYGETLSF